jgi:hypothetical protein
MHVPHFFIYLSVDGHLVLVDFLAIIKSAAWSKHRSEEISLALI